MRLDEFFNLPDILTLSQNAEEILERTEEIPEDIRKKVESICEYIRDEVAFRRLIHYDRHIELARVGVRTLPELLRLSSVELFEAIGKRRLKYRNILRNLNKAHIPHDFIEKPWEK